MSWLHERDEGRLRELWQLADEARRAGVGDAVHLRGLVEISSHCVRQCAYCGLRSENRGLERYRMTIDEILECTHKAVQFGYGTVVLQSGEDYAITVEWMSEVVRRIKEETSLAVTLSLGERSTSELRAWRDAGADRYLIRIETSDPALYARIHPSYAGRVSDRVAMLHTLRALGYEIGSGVMVGIPGQSHASLADDLMLFRELDLDMIGIGPYLPHPKTPLGATFDVPDAPDPNQPPNTECMTHIVVALARLLCPEANIPGTTALATINPRNGRELALQRGANVVMPNLTPVRYRHLYEIYPSKACIHETDEMCHGCLRGRIASIGRHAGSGPGGRRRLSATH